MKNTKKNDIQGLKFIFTCAKSIEKLVKMLYTITEYV